MKYDINFDKGTLKFIPENNKEKNLVRKLRADLKQELGTGYKLELVAYHDISFRDDELKFRINATRNYQNRIPIRR